MFRTHIFEYAPILIGGKKKYYIGFPINESPIPFKTMTSDMLWWYGQLKDVNTVYMANNGREAKMGTAMIRIGKDLTEVTGEIIAPIVINGPCVVMEHITVDGVMSYLLGKDNILCGNQNFVNFGIPGGKHIRIDIYTGDYRIIE